MKKNSSRVLPLLFLSLLAGMALCIPGRVAAETVSWTAVTTYTDGTPIEPTKTVTYDVFWSQDAGLSPASLRAVVSSVSQTSATFNPDVLGMPRGQTVYFTGDAVLNTGERSALASAYSWVVPPASPPPGPPTLTGLSISGPSTVNENGSGTYRATAAWSDGSTTTVTPVWSENSSYASIGSAGLLTATAVPSNQTATVSASYTSGSVTRTANLNVTIVDMTATLSGLAISGPSTVNENGSGTYRATAAWTNGSTTTVTPAWSENSSYASINSAGLLTATAVPSNQTATVSASYTSGGVTRTANLNVTIVDIPPGTLAPVQNVAVTGPVTTSPTRQFRLSWDPVTSYADGTPIAAGSVRYTAYWSADPALPASSLRPLVSSTSATSVTFDPAAAGMATDQRVYFTTVVETTSGGQSPLSAGVSWVALNPGPAAPSGGTIIRR